jgi:hypothetical protein
MTLLLIRLLVASAGLALIVVALIARAHGGWQAWHRHRRYKPLHARSYAPPQTAPLALPTNTKAAA